MKSKAWIPWVIVIILVVMLAGSAIKSYNNMVTKEELVAKHWADVENVYQRRLDLIPNLVSTVKGYAEHEQNTLTGVIEARAKATQTKIAPENLNASSLQQFQAAQGELSSALSRLLVSVERYPDLKANQNFLDLQAQLEGTENRIAVERRNFNQAAQDFNTFIRRFPKNIWASLFGFEKKAYFESVADAEKAPKVEF